MTENTTTAPATGIELQSAPARTSAASPPSPKTGHGSSPNSSPPRPPRAHRPRSLEDKLAIFPRRKTGTVHVQDASSFIEYLAKHALSATEVWADLSRTRLVGVINAHDEASEDRITEGVAGHGDHRVALELLPTKAWQKWTGRDKQWLNQSEFAEHLEDNAVDILNPDAATMLEIAEHFHAAVGADFKSAQRLSDGNVSLRYEETTTARAGQSGDLEIPKTFTVALAPFEGAERVPVDARFRYRINSGKLVLSYALLNVEEIAQRVFLDYVDSVRAEITAPLFQGRPE